MSGIREENILRFNIFIQHRQIYPSLWPKLDWIHDPVAMHFTIQKKLMDIITLLLICLKYEWE